MINSVTNTILKPEESFQAQGITDQSVIYLCILFQSCVQYGDQQVIVSYYEGDSVSSVLRDTLQVLYVHFVSPSFFILKHLLRSINSMIVINA